MHSLAHEFYSHPKIISGACALENIPSELANNDAQKPLVITNRYAADRGLAKSLINAFYDSDCLLGGIYDDVRDYAGIGLARQAAVIFKERGCDSIIALGGGPSADVAKAANILVSENTDELFRFQDSTSIYKRLKPLIMVPDCVSTGTEAGKTATVDHRRFCSDFLYPDAVIIDSRMTTAGSAKAAAEFSLTAIDNALTAFFDKEPGPMKNAFVHAALSFISENLNGFLKNPESRIYSLAMANASAAAAIASSNSDPGLVQLLSAELEKITSVSRAVFIGILTAAYLDWTVRKNGPPGQDILLASGGMELYSQTPRENRSAMGIEIISNLSDLAFRATGATLSSLKIPDYRLKKACTRAGGRPDARFAARDFLDVIETAKKGDAG